MEQTLTGPRLLRGSRLSGRRIKSLIRSGQR
jgi:hypothetical protein